MKLCADVFVPVITTHLLTCRCSRECFLPVTRKLIVTAAEETEARKCIIIKLQAYHEPVYASPYLWNQLSPLFRRPHSVHSPPGRRGGE